MPTLAKNPQWEILSPGNTKTGDAASFDLPAADTCPSATELCKRLCYSIKLCQTRPGVSAKYARNLKFVWDAKFVSYMVRCIPRGTFRIHVSGDFFHPDYVSRWIQIASRRPDVQFYCYTRSWREHDIWRQIRKLAALPNVTVNISCDKETGKPKKTCEPYRWCYLSTDDTAPKWLRKGDLIFRSNHNARAGNHQWKRAKAISNGNNPDLVAPLIHRIGQAPVCPFERGKKLVDFSCSQCKICVEAP